MLKLVGQSTVHIIEPARRAVAGTWRGQAGVRLEAWVVVEIALVVDAAVALSCAPYLLLALRIRERLWEGGWCGGESASLLGSEVGLAVEAEVEM